MAQEIERKFLLRNDTWRTGAVGVHFRQAYLSTEPERAVRIRTAGERAFLTIKGKSVGAARLEYEYPIPLTDANEMLDRLCLRPVIEKTRYRIRHGGLSWEVDDFEGVNVGLVIAEVELVSEDQAIDLPGWVGNEVTGDPRYYNANLITNPFSQW